MPLLRRKPLLRSSSTPLVSRIWIVVTMRDGKMVSGREYSTREEALRAAGLPVSGE